MRQYTNLRRHSQQSHLPQLSHLPCYLKRLFPATRHYSPCVARGLGTAVSPPLANILPKSPQGMRRTLITTSLTTTAAPYAPCRLCPRLYRCRVFSHLQLRTGSATETVRHPLCPHGLHLRRTRVPRHSFLRPRQSIDTGKRYPYHLRRRHCHLGKHLSKCWTRIAISRLRRRACLTYALHPTRLPSSSNSCR